MQKVIKAAKQAFPTSCRLFMGFIFLIYGIPKLVSSQFQVKSGSIEALPAAKAVGESFVVAWKFFGYSRWYEIFIGIGEITAAILIMIPVTATLGAVIYLPIAANIMMVNYFYVKGVAGLTTLLVLLNIYLLWVDRKKLMLIFWNSKNIAQIWDSLEKQSRDET